MRPVLPILLLALLGATPGPGPFTVRLLRPEGGPAVALHRRVSPLAALRLSVPVPADLPEGAVELLQELARDRASAEADRYGAALELRHEPGHAIIAVTGPVAAFDGLVDVLRHATAPPDLSAASLVRARARTEDRVLAALESPAPRLRRRLWHQLYGGPPLGAPAATRLEPEAIRSARAALYDPARMRLVVVGDVPATAVRSAFADWATGERGERGGVGGAADRPAPQPDTAPPPPRVQALRPWTALGYRVTPNPADPDATATLVVAAELVARRVAGSALRDGAAEAWFGPADPAGPGSLNRRAGPALVLLGSAEPGDSAIAGSAGISELGVRGDTAADRTTGRYLRRLVAEAAALTGPRNVREAADAVRDRILLDARTAAGRADAIGRVADLVPDAGAEAFLASLDRVTAVRVRRLLADILAEPAEMAVVAP